MFHADSSRQNRSRKNSSMLIFSYLARRFFAYVCTVGLMLAFIFNFIEFFEKLLRLKHASVGTIIHFVALNFIPTFFDLLPICAWLAMCLLIKDLVTSQEWELLQVLMFIPKRLLLFAISIGAIMSLSTFFLYEGIGSNLTFQAEHFRKNTFKQGTGKKLFDRWFELADNQFFHCELADLENNSGKGLAMISMDHNFQLTTIVNASDFYLDPVSSTITAPMATRYDAKSPGTLVHHSFTLQAPELFSQFALSNEEQSLKNLLSKTVMHSAKKLPAGIYRDIQGQLFTRLAYYLQILLYPLITACLFMCLYHPYAQWVLMLSAYPIVLIAGLIGNGLFHSGMHPVIILVPYILLLTIILLGLGLQIRPKPTLTL